MRARDVRATAGSSTRPPRLILHPSSFSSAFSLVEVVLAIGIVSFALLTIIGLFGGIMKSSGDNSRRREMAETVDSLRSFLNRTNFDTAYGWVRSNKEFLYLTYRVGSNGIPDTNSQVVGGLWTNADASGLEAYELARSGSWLRARLGVSPSNPGGTNLPAAAGNYSRASLFVLADIAPVAGTTQTATNSSRLQSTMVITR
jgi:type II secretory pathway pseudopilin PulG